MLDEELGAACQLARFIELRQHLGRLLRLVQREQPRNPSLLIAFLLQKRRALSLGAAIELDDEAPEPLPIGSKCPANRVVT